jgi:hypothetical protein
VTNDLRAVTLRNLRSALATFEALRETELVVAKSGSRLSAKAEADLARLDLEINEARERIAELERRSD